MNKNITSHTSHTIIYGYNKNIIDSIINSTNSIVILIEPRKKYMDNILNLKKTNDKIIFIPKVLMETNVLRQVILYSKNDNEYTVLQKPNVITSRQDVYTTSLSNIIKGHDIKQVDEIIINITIDNIQKVLDNIISFSNIITKIHIATGQTLQCELLTTCFKSDNTDVYYHNNIGLEIPKIYLFPSQQFHFIKKNQQLNSHYINFFQFIKRYNINITNEVLINETDETNVDIKKNDVLKVELYEHMLNNLHTIFSNIKHINNDIIMQFNPDYLIIHDTFNINYSTEDDILYIYKQYDIIYGNKNTMYNLYMLLKSDEFKNYIKEKQILKGKLYKFFVKQYFYDYITKIFKVIF